jgi:hypothetical protein
MATLHRVYSFFGGDDVFLNLQLVDQENKPYNIDALDEVKWLLHTPDAKIWPHDAIKQTINSADGQIRIWLPAAETTKFVGGIWTDFVRVVCDGITSTLLYGPINVTKDPWTHEQAIVPMMVGFSENIVVLMDRNERIHHRQFRRAA